MKHGEHPRILGMLRDETIRHFESQIEALRHAKFSGRPPATSTPRNYENSLRLFDDRFILVNRPSNAPRNSALQFCLGRGSSILHQQGREGWIDWNPHEEEYTAIVQVRAPWVAAKLAELALI